MQDKLFFGSALVFVIALFCFAVYGAHVEQKKWEQFKVEHECREAGYIDGDEHTGFGVGSNGDVTVITTTTPRKTRWVCDGGDTEIYR